MLNRETLHSDSKVFPLKRILFRFITILLILLLGSTAGFAQPRALKDHIKDTTDKVMLCDTPTALADSFFSSIRSTQFEDMLRLTPSYKFMVKVKDSMDLELENTKMLYRQQSWNARVKKKHKKLLKAAKKNKINLKKIELIDKSFEYGYHPDGHRFCYVVLKCKRNRKEFFLKFLAVELNNYWFLGDELELSL